MLTLTHPLLAGLVALAGTLGVLLLYVLRLRRRPVRVSTISFFAAAIDDIEANVPWRRLRMSWMLLLHLMVVWLLALGIGQPVSNIDADRTDLIVIIDRSASMSMKSGVNTTALDIAKQSAIDMCEEVLDSGGRVAILAADARTQTVLPISTSRPAMSTAIERLRPVDQVGRLDQAIDTARSLAAAVAAPSTNRSNEPSESSEQLSPLDPQNNSRIVVFTDGVSPISSDHRQGVEVRRIPQPSADVDNLGVVNIAARRESPVGPQCQLLFRVVNSFAESRIAPVRIAVNGEVQQRFTIELDGASTGPDGVRVAGSSTRTVSLAIPREAVVTVSIARSDALAADDSASVVVPSPRPVRILLVTRSSSATELDGVPPSSSSRFLNDVLQEVVGIGQAGGAGTSGELVVASPTRLAGMNQSQISEFSVAVFDEIEPPARFPIGVIAFGSRAAICTPGVGKGERSPTRPVWWDRASSVFAENPIESVLIRNSLTVGEISNGVRILARGVDGPLVLHQPQTPSSPGRIAVLFTLSESNWPLQVSFPIFVARSLQLVAPYALDGLAQSFTTGEVLAFQLPSPNPTQIVLRRQSDDFELSMPVAKSQTEITMGPFDLAGVYQLLPSLGPPNAKVSFVALNVMDERISTLQPVKDVSAVSEQSASAASRVGKGEWWRICVLAAGLMLALEWIVFSVLQLRAGK